MRRRVKPSACAGSSRACSMASRWRRGRPCVTHGSCKSDGTDGMGDDHVSMNVFWTALLAVMLIGGASDAMLIGPPPAHAQAPTAEVSPAAPPPAPAPHEITRNPYGLESLWKQGDLVT